MDPEEEEELRRRSEAVGRLFGALLVGIVDAVPGGPGGAQRFRALLSAVGIMCIRGAADMSEGDPEPIIADLFGMVRAHPPIRVVEMARDLVFSLLRRGERGGD